MLKFRNQQHYLFPLGIIKRYIEKLAKSHAYFVLLSHDEGQQKLIKNPADIALLTNLIEESSERVGQTNFGCVLSLGHD